MSSVKNRLKARSHFKNLKRLKSELLGKSKGRSSISKSRDQLGKPSDGHDDNGFGIDMGFMQEGAWERAGVDRARAARLRRFKSLMSRLTRLHDMQLVFFNHVDELGEDMMSQLFLTSWKDFTSRLELWGDHIESLCREMEAIADSVDPQIWRGLQRDVNKAMASRYERRGSASMTSSTPREDSVVTFATVDEEPQPVLLEGLGGVVDAKLAQQEELDAVADTDDGSRQMLSDGVFLPPPFKPPPLFVSKDISLTPITPRPKTGRSVSTQTTYRAKQLLGKGAGLGTSTGSGVLGSFLQPIRRAYTSQQFLANVVKSPATPKVREDRKLSTAPPTPVTEGGKVYQVLRLAGYGATKDPVKVRHSTFMGRLGSRVASINQNLRTKRTNRVEKMLVWAFPVVLFLGMLSICNASHTTRELGVVWQSSLESVFTELLEVSMVRIVDQRMMHNIEHQLRNGVDIVEGMQASWHGSISLMKDLDENMGRQLDSTLFDFLNIHSNVYSVQMATERGAYIAATRYPVFDNISDYEYRLLMKERERPQDLNVKICELILGVDVSNPGNLVRNTSDIIGEKCHYDPRDSEWYQMAVDNPRQQLWSKTYLDQISKFALTVASPIYDRQTQRLSGVVGVTFLLDNFSDTLHHATPEGATSFIFERDSLFLVATSSLDLVHSKHQQRIETTEITHLPHGKQITFAVNNLSLKRSCSRNSSLAFVHPDCPNMRYKGDVLEANEFYMAAQSKRAEQGINWVEVTVLHRASYFAELSALEQLALITALLIFMTSATAALTVTKSFIPRISSSMSPLKTMLLIYAALLLLSYAAIWCVWYVEGNAAADALVKSRLLPQIDKAIKEKLEDVVKQVPKSCEHAQTIVARGNIVISSDEVPCSSLARGDEGYCDYFLDRFLCSQVKSNNSLKETFAIGVDGTFVSCNWLNNTRMMLSALDASTQHELKIFAATTQGAPHRNVSQPLSDDMKPRTISDRAWLHSALPDVPKWVDVSGAVDQETLLLTMAQNLRNREGDMIGIYGVSIELSRLSQLLAEIAEDVAHGAQIVMFECDNHRRPLIATSFDGERTHPGALSAMDENGIFVRQLVDQMGSPYVQASLREIQRRFDSFKSVEKHFQATMETEEGVPFILDVRRSRDDYGRDWMYFLIIPRKIILGGIYEASIWSVVLSGIVFVSSALTLTGAVLGIGRIYSSHLSKMLTIPQPLRKFVDGDSSLSQRAAIAYLYLQDAGTGEKSFAHEASRLYYNVYLLLRSRGYILVTRIATLVHCLIVVWEPQKSSDSRMLSDFYDTRPWTILSISVASCAIHFIDFLFRAYAEGGLSYVAKLKGFIHFSLVALLLSDAIAHACFADVLFYSRFLRPFPWIFQSHSLIKLCKLLLRTIPSLVDILVLFLSLMITFSGIAITLFESKYTYHNTDLVQSKFDSCAGAMLSLYVLLSGDNYPDLMIPSLESFESIVPSMYFVCWLIIGTIFLVGMVVSKFNTVFSKHRAYQEENADVWRSQALLFAFNTLDVQGEGRVSFVALRDVLKCHNKRYSNDEMKRIFFNLDQNLDGELTFVEFSSILQNLIFRAAAPEVKPKPNAFGLWITSNSFQAFSKFLVVLHGGVTLLYGSVDDEDTLDILCLLCVVIHSLRMVAMVFGYGPTNLWASDGFNRFNLLVILVTDGLLLHSWWFEEVSIHPRIVCVFPLTLSLSALSNSRKLVSVIVRVFPSFLDIFQIVIAVIFMEGIIGMELLAGKFETLRSWRDTEDIVGYLNFDSFGSSLLVIVNVIFSSGWSDILWASIHTVGMRSILYFVPQHIFWILIINLFVGLVIDAFTQEMEAERDLVPEQKDNAVSENNESV